MSNSIEMVRQYMLLRAHKKQKTEEFEKSMERVNAAMQKLEASLLQQLIDSGADRIGAKGVGTVYRSTKTSATVEDRDQFMEWVRDTEAWDALDVKANKTFIRTHLNEGKEVPGVKYTEFHTIGVQRD